MRTICRTLGGVTIMASLTATEARKRLYSLVDEVKESHEPVQIVGKKFCSPCF
jgi:hypothetical protein